MTSLLLVTANHKFCHQKNGKYLPIYEVWDCRLKIPERVLLFLNTDLVPSPGLLSKYQYLSGICWQTFLSHKCELLIPQQLSYSEGLEFPAFIFFCKLHFSFPQGLWRSQNWRKSVSGHCLQYPWLPRPSAGLVLDFHLQVVHQYRCKAFTFTRVEKWVERISISKSPSLFTKYVQINHFLVQISIPKKLRWFKVSVQVT